MNIVYYYTNWSTYARNYQVSDLPIDIMPEIAYAFFNIQNNIVVLGDRYADAEKRFPDDLWTSPQLDYYGNLNEFRKLKQKGKVFRLTLSIGGWSWSKNFSEMVSTDVHRANAVKSIADIVSTYNIFDGINIDWEYISNDGINYGNAGNKVNKNDAQNCLIFLKLLRERFPNFKISIACAADPKKVKFSISDYNSIVDEFHIMTYDFADGNWGDTITSHHTNLYPTSFTKFSIHETVNYYISNGASASKILIGAAFYSRGFSNTSGIGLPCSGGSPDMSWENGVCDYKDLPKSGSIEMWDDVAKASYSYDPVKRVLNSYDTEKSISAKCEYVKQYGLGGIIVWEASGDDKSNSLVRTLAGVDSVVDVVHLNTDKYRIVITKCD